MPNRKSFLIRHVRPRPLSEHDLSKYLLRWRTKDLYNDPGAFPMLSTEEIFGRPGPLSLEIGCGTGEFLCALAEKDPGSYFVGTDVNLKSLEVATAGAASRSLENILFIKAPVQWLYPLMVPCSLQAVYVHFPDPCLRPKYRKRRLLNDTFMENMHRALVPDGTLSIVTDNAELLDILLPLVEATTHFEKAHPQRYITGFEPDVKSRYQLYWERHSKPIYRLLLRNKADT